MGIYGHKFDAYRIDLHPELVLEQPIVVTEGVNEVFHNIVETIKKAIHNLISAIMKLLGLKEIDSTSEDKLKNMKFKAEDNLRKAEEVKDPVEDSDTVKELKKETERMNEEFEKTAKAIKFAGDVANYANSEINKSNKETSENIKSGWDDIHSQMSDLDQKTKEMKDSQKKAQDSMDDLEKTVEFTKKFVAQSMEAMDKDFDKIADHVADLKKTEEGREFIDTLLKHLEH